MYDNGDDVVRKKENDEEKRTKVETDREIVFVIDSLPTPHIFRHIA